MKIGIIGTGNISYRHFEEFSKINGINIEAVCDVNEENLIKFISCLLYTSPSARDATLSRMPSSA